MKIGLIDPGSKKIILNEKFPHLGLAYIAAVLDRNDRQISILDVSMTDENKICQFLNERYDIIGISATSFTFSQALELAKKIKETNSDVITVLGGPHVSIGLESTLYSPYFDYSVVGEGELTMLELVKLLQKNTKPSAKDLSSISGLIFRNDSDIVVNPQRPRIDHLDNLPFPAFQYFTMEEYGIYPILTSRGCPFGCTFCAIKAIWGTTWRHRSPENIVSEIENAREKFDWEKKPFSIVDDSFNVKPKRVEEFCDLIIEKGLDIQWFSAGFRADKVTRSLAEKMKKSGCIAVSIGIESASNDVLRKIKKKETIEEISQGCEILAEVGIPVEGQFMIGNPGDTFETVQKSIEFARKHKFANAGFYLALPYPKTELWDYVREHGRFLKEDYTQFHHFANEPVFETPEFPAKERTKAYIMARKLSLQLRIKEELRRKLNRLKHMDFENLSLEKIIKALSRTSKYFFDLILRRHEKV